MTHSHTKIRNCVDAGWKHELKDEWTALKVKGQGSAAL